MATATETPDPEPTATADWLSYVNAHRALAHLDPVTEDPAMSHGDWLHARYMVKADHYSHVENRNSPYYTQEGFDAGLRSNLMYIGETFNPSPPTILARYSIDAWMTAPFHQVQILDPRLRSSGFGQFHDAEGSVRYGAALDVYDVNRPPDLDVKYPIRYPEEGEILPVEHYVGAERPDPLTSCPNYYHPVGAPIILMLGYGIQNPGITHTEIANDDGAVIKHCAFDASNYKNPDSDVQNNVRSILTGHGTVVLMPRDRLRSGRAYTVTIQARNGTNQWSFRTRKFGEAWP
jgi:hypothetical protein